MTETSIVVPPPETIQGGHYWQDPQWQRVWLATQETKWRSLAVIPADADVPIWDVARALVDVGCQHQGIPIVLADLRSVGLSLVKSVIAEAERRVATGEIVLIALSDIEINPAAAHIAKLADKAILCVRLGSTPLRSAKNTIQAIGKDRFLGTLLLRP